MQLSSEQKSRIARSIQFGRGPWNWTGIKIRGEKYAVDSSGNEYLMHKLELDNYPEWHVIHLRSLKAISKTVSDPLIRIAGPLILTLCFLIGLSVFFLYQKASVEILKRQAAENALRESEERYRRLYHHTPAMLHSIDTKGRIVSVSDYWSEVMGYRREKVIGRRLTSFFTDMSSEMIFPVLHAAMRKKRFFQNFLKPDSLKMLLISLSRRTVKP